MFKAVLKIKLSPPGKTKLTWLIFLPMYLSLVSQPLTASKLTDVSRLYQFARQLLTTPANQWFPSSIMALSQLQQEQAFNSSGHYLDFYHVNPPNQPDYLFIPFPVRRHEPNSPNLSPEICEYDPDCRLQLVSNYISGFMWSLSSCQTNSERPNLGVYVIEPTTVLKQHKPSHFYLRIRDSCRGSKPFSYGGVGGRYMLLSFCETLTPELSMEVSLPLGPSEDSEIGQLVDTGQEYPSLREIAEDDVALYLQEFERHHDPIHPAANQFALKSLGKGISTQVIESFNFLRSVALKRHHKSLFSRAQAEEVILSARVSMKLLKLAGIPFLPLKHYLIPARTGGEYAVYSLQKKIEKESFYETDLGHHSESLEWQKGKLDDIIELLTKCDIENSSQLQTFNFETPGINVAIDPNFSNYCEDENSTIVADLSPFLWAVGNQSPEINDVILDQGLADFSDHIASLNRSPLHRYAFFAGMLFRAAVAADLRLKQCREGVLECHELQLSSDRWHSLHQHAIDRLSQLPQVHSEVQFWIAEQKKIFGLPDEVSSLDLIKQKSDTTRMFRMRMKQRNGISSAFYAGVDKFNKHEATDNDSASTTKTYLLLLSTIMSQHVNNWVAQRQANSSRQLSNTDSTVTFQQTPYYLNDLEFTSYILHALGLGYTDTPNTPKKDSLKLSVLNWLDRYHTAVSPYHRLYIEQLYQTETRSTGVDNDVPAMLLTLHAAGIKVNILVIQPDDHFQPQGQLFTVSRERHKVGHTLVKASELPDLLARADQGTIVLGLHQTSDAPLNKYSRYALLDTRINRILKSALKGIFEETVAAYLPTLIFAQDSWDNAVKPMTFQQLQTRFASLLQLLQYVYIDPDKKSPIHNLDYYLPEDLRMARKSINPGDPESYLHFFTALFHWFENNHHRLFNGVSPPEEIILLQPAMMFIVSSQEQFSMWRLKRSTKPEGTITKEFSYKANLDQSSFNRNKQLIFFTNSLVSPTGHFIMPFHSQANWWVAAETSQDRVQPKKIGHANSFELLMDKMGIRIRTSERLDIASSTTFAAKTFVEKLRRFVYP